MSFDLLPLPAKELLFIKRLHQKKYREKYRCLLVEGAKSVAALLASPYKVRYLVATASYATSQRNSWQAARFPIYEVSPPLLARLGSFAINQQVIAIANRIESPSNFRLVKSAHTLLLDGITDPGNLGTIIRIAHWFGISQLVCSPTTVAYDHPKAIQASMGSFFYLQGVQYRPLAPYLLELEREEIPVIAGWLQGQNLYQVDLPIKGVLLIGSEAHGIDKSLFPYITHPVRIPGSGQTDSLNAAVATGILCSHWLGRTFDNPGGVLHLK